MLTFMGLKTNKNSPLDSIKGHLDAALAQSIPSDDSIIVGHIRDAKTIIDDLWRQQKTMSTALDRVTTLAERMLEQDMRALAGPSITRSMMKDVETDRHAVALVKAFLTATRGEGE